MWDKIIAFMDAMIIHLLLGIILLLNTGLSQFTPAENPLPVINDYQVQAEIARLKQAEEYRRQQAIAFAAHQAAHQQKRQQQAVHLEAIRQQIQQETQQLRDLQQRIQKEAALQNTAQQVDL